MKISERWHHRLQWLKYGILIGLIPTAFYSLTLAERLAEVEPFKTSITLVFVRSWPFVLYAVLLLGVGLFVHKFYCAMCVRSAPGWRSSAGCGCSPG
ncbi:hypothetical protein UMZ34_17835 [Halopseudomonas pachastrellae]|nr:hypothetical protein UMZ34_17835 [Halopseudomonas pachastrellae]